MEHPHPACEVETAIVLGQQVRLRPEIRAALTRLPGGDAEGASEGATEHGFARKAAIAGDLTNLAPLIGGARQDDRRHRQTTTADIVRDPPDRLKGSIQGCA